MDSRRLSAVALSLFLTVYAPHAAFAAPKTAKSAKFKSFSGLFQGNCSVQSIDGSDVFYPVVRLTIDARGIIKGQANREIDLDQSQIEDLSGKLTTVRTVPSAHQSVARGTITLSDGAVIKITLIHVNVAGLTRGLQTQIISAKMNLGADYLGSCALPSQN